MVRRGKRSAPGPADVCAPPRRARSLLLCWALASPAGAPAPVLGDGLLINEVVSSNITGLPDEYEVDTSNCPVPDCVQWYRRLGESIFDGEYPDWVELYNPGPEEVSLLGYGLSDDPAFPLRWRFPDVAIGAGEHLVVFASGKDKSEEYLHTNFKLSRRGETLALTTPAGATVDRVETGEIPVDYSLGRDPDNPSRWVFFRSPTPGAANTSLVSAGITDAVTASHRAGFYEGPISLTLAAASPTARIRYTVNGDEPDFFSWSYTEPIEIAETTVIRAEAVEGFEVSSRVFTRTFFIGEDFTFPVVSLTSDRDNLFHEERGILVPGRDADEGNRVANYWNDWERPVHIEFFEPDGTRGFSAEAGMKVFGWGSRRNPQKSLSVFFRDKYGLSELDYQLFPDLPLDRFKAFVLRAGASDARSGGTFFRDPFGSSLAGHRNVDIQAFRPAVVFVNGQYWGIQNIREKMNEDYLASHHGADKNNVDMVSRYWRRTYPVVIEGDDVAYLGMEAFLATADMARPEAFAEASSLIDLDNFLDYTAAQIILANYDWPGNNNKVWRERRPGARWRSLMYDLDYTQASNGGQNSASHNTLRHATTAGGTGWPNPDWTTMIFRRLLENAEFEARFINRMADLLNSAFLPATVHAKLDAMVALYEPEMPAHIDRWAGTGDVIPSMATWRSNVGAIRSFAAQRPAQVRGHLEDFFELGGWDELEVHVEPAGAGRVEVNSLLVDAPSWSGSYANGVPVRLSALPRPGFGFAGWTGITILEGGDAASPAALINVNRGRTLTANFEPAPGALNQVLISEINYHSADAPDPGDWVELLNTYAIPVDIGGWVFKDGSFGNAFAIPEGTVLEAGSRLVLCRDTAAFLGVFPGAENIAGDLRFNLDNGGEELRLFDDHGNLVDAVEYGDDPPWPTSPDGGGTTLALIDAALDNADPASWAPSRAPLGTPGAENDVSAALEPVEILSVGLDGAGRFRLRFVPEPGVLYRVQVSTDLLDWSEGTPVEEPGTFTDDLPAAAEGRRFYRLGAER